MLNAIILSTTLSTPLDRARKLAHLTG